MLDMEQPVFSPQGPGLNALLAGIAAGVREALPGLKTCAVHDGRFRAAELLRWAMRAPTVLVAWLGTPGTETPGVMWTDCDHRFGAFVVTRDTPGLPRWKAARRMVLVLLLLIPRARWGLTDIGAAEYLPAGNLYSGEVDKANVALWAVTWRQALRLEASADGTCPALPAELYASAQGDRSVLALAHLAQAARPVRSAVASLKWQSSQQESAESDTSSER